MCVYIYICEYLCVGGGEVYKDTQIDRSMRNATKRLRQSGQCAFRRLVHICVSVYMYIYTYIHIYLYKHTYIGVSLCKCLNRYVER